MHLTRLILTCSAVAAVIAMSGCDPASSPSATAPATATSAAAPATTAASSAPATTAAAMDAATVKACDAIKKDIKDNAAKIAKAVKIGPPAGHFAVSAQWSAGATTVIAHSFDATGAVAKAADEVQQEMSNLADAYDSPDAKPSRKKLDAAVKNLNAACSAA